MPTRDDVRFLADSPDRFRLLARLRERPGSPRDLAEDLSVSRRTVQRNLSELGERGWAERGDGGYSLTTTGRLVAEEHASYVEALDLLAEFDPLYRHLPDRDHAPDPQWLRDATLVVAEPDNPQAPVHHYVTALRSFETRTIRMISPVLSRLFHDAHADLALRGVHTELVMSATTIERARSLNPAEFDAVVSAGVLDLYRYPDGVDFGLTLGDRRALVGAYDRDGQLRACLDATADEVLSWAETLFERYRSGAARVDPPIPLPFGRSRD
ncbi:helix-turn-helix transcriptional regulator [Halegenticoccus soli]|uniref:helix-turn-helix transcriptional regulator n=1 Tax=Halegenticoccus soli TaxID=1985678 RepID=UPI000C6E635E|nr:HTH domain-containing protein [Halegenticoccus soli]